MRRAIVVLALVLVLPACDAGGGGASDTGPDVGVAPNDVADSDVAVAPDVAEPPAGCEGRYGLPVAAAQLDTTELFEVSGIARSGRRDDLLWMHNDRGGDGHLFAVGTDGRVRARVAIEGVTIVDSEDIALAACPDDAATPCLWLADIGTNNGKRTEVAVLAIPEPVVADGEVPAELTASPTAVYRLAYPKGEPNSEALAVQADGGAFYLFEKTGDSVAEVFAPPTPLRADALSTMVVRARFEAPSVGAGEDANKITAADLHPSGQRLLLQVYSGTFEYRFAAGQAIEDIAAVEPTRAAAVPLGADQAEAVGYDASGTGFWMVSEDPHADGRQPLYHHACAQ